MTASPDAVDSIEETKKQYLTVLTGSYFIAGFFWVFSTLGSVDLLGNRESGETFLSSMIVLMFSNGLWEVLTGWYADKFKRRFSISAGFLVYFAGFFIMGLAYFIHPSEGKFKLFVWLAGVTVWSLGPALLSGAQEAWLVDRCNFLSANPPEPLDNVFKKSARRGVIAKASGFLICFFVLYLLDVGKESTQQGQGGRPLVVAFSLAAGIAALSSLMLFIYSRRLEEEYWTDPKYQTDESLLAFLWMGTKDLWKSPYRWFTLAFVGATSLNYLLSATVWPYLGHDKINISGRSIEVGFVAGIIIVTELIAGYLSGPFSKRIDRIAGSQWRMPAASLLYLIPVLPLYLIHWVLVDQTDSFLFILIAATFLFRTAHASVFGTLNAVGQLAIESDERRAVLISMSSAIAAWLVAIVLLAIMLSTDNQQPATSIDGGGTSLPHVIVGFWVYTAIPAILMLAIGGYLVARRGSK